MRIGFHLDQTQVNPSHDILIMSLSFLTSRPISETNPLSLCLASFYKLGSDLSALHGASAVYVNSCLVSMSSNKMFNILDMIGPVFVFFFYPLLKPACRLGTSTFLSKTNTTPFFFLSFFLLSLFWCVFLKSSCFKALDTCPALPSVLPNMWRSL